MSKLQMLITGAFLLCCCSVFAQSSDERVLFTVEDVPVTVDEFVYIYSKTNGDNADFSETSLQEYLDLYVKFKLKVQRAKEMKLDTIVELQQELAGYRRQLADSYLIDRAIGEQLVAEAYEHIQQDVDISHILIVLKNNASPADTLKAFQQITAAHQRILNGDAFEDVATESSQDKYSATRNGRVGFTTALYPDGLYPLEKQAFSAEIGKVVGPIRTTAGYHLLKVNERRPARGEVEIAHILIRKNEENPGQAKISIDKIYQQLQTKEASFDDLATSMSEDQKTAANKGYIGFFGIGKFSKNFEDTAFALTADDSFSAPIETEAGWHIIKRISKKDIQPFQVEKPRLEGRIRQDSRFETAKVEMLQRIKAESNYSENTTLLNNFKSSLQDTFVTFRWKTPEPSAEVLFTLGDDNSFKVTMGEFTNFLSKGTRERVALAQQGNSATVAEIMYQDFVNQQLLQYEQTQLEQRYPEFRSLMREYEEGILLFEATKMEVWDKASQDTIGLRNFFSTISGKYRWTARARTTIYRIGISHADQAEAIRTYAQNHNAIEVMDQFNINGETIVSVDDSNYEKDRNPDLNGVEWKAGVCSELIENNRSRSIKFLKIEEIMPAADKTLEEARGYIIADYQDQLEREWVDDLRSQFKVNVKQNVFDSLIKK